MYGIFTYIWVSFWANVGKYAIHGAYGYSMNVNALKAVDIHGNYGNHKKQSDGDV